MTSEHAVKFGVAITSVGRWDHLGTLLGDLAAQSLRPHAVAVAHHGDDDSDEGLSAVLAAYADRLTLHATQSPRGASHGRNAAAAMFGDDVDWLYFPNDTSRLDGDFLERLARHCVAPTTVCAVRFVDPEGSRNELPPRGSPLTRRTVWGAIEPATAILRSDFIRAGGFDPSIGTGAQTPWQSGEITDLLLRMSTKGDVVVDWIDDITVHAHLEFSHLTPRERRRKLRGYGRGTGYIFRRWNYPAVDKFRHVVGGALMPIRNPAKFRLGDGAMLAVGRAEGILGRTFSGGADYRAVLR